MGSPFPVREFTTAAREFTTAAREFTTAAREFTTPAREFTKAAREFTTPARAFTTQVLVRANKCDPSKTLIDDSEEAGFLSTCGPSTALILQSRDKYGNHVQK
eukprot:70359-Pyramimonas_sp.AAC.1